MRYFIVFLLSFTFISGVLDAGEQYDLVLIDISSEADIQKILEAGLDVVKIKPGYYAEAVVRSDQLENIYSLGLSYRIPIRDLQQFYSSQMTGEGIFGDYLTYSEAMSSMDSVHNAYPSIVGEKMILPNTILGDTTWDGNYVWAIKVSDNVDVQENEPEALIIGLHHAREPISTSICIYFLHWLADNYGTDPDATWLVDNRQIWIVPMANPDGYVYNETSYGYGGMWRKNRRNNGGSYGVDPNRNYPYKWGYDNSGSSPDPSDETYRGPSPGSEPCIQSVMWLYQQHQFVTSIDYHSHGGMYLYPWGYDQILTPDDWKFDSITNMMASANGYSPGTPWQLLYPVNGGSVDWGYGDTTKPKVYHVSPEVGSAFWQDDQLQSQLNETHLGNKITCWSAGLYLRALQINIAEDRDGNLRADPGDTVDISLDLFNYSLDESGSGVNCYVLTDDPYVYILDAQSSYGSIDILSSKTSGSDLITIAFDPSTPSGHIVDLTAVVSADGNYLSTNDLRIRVGSPTSGFFDDFESGITHWNPEGIWQLRTNYSYSPTHSMGTGSYGNQQNISTTLINGVDFPTELVFWNVYDLENGYDYGYVEVSSDEQPSWVSVKTVNGENHWSWAEETVDLSAYSSDHNLKVRFRLDSDWYVTGGGWYVDDVSILCGSSSDSIPSTPSPYTPTNQSSTNNHPILTVENSTDPHGLTLTYTFRVFQDSLMTDLAREQTGVTQGSGGYTSWEVNPPLSANQTYYWRVYADNGYYRSNLSDQWCFSTTAGAVEEPEDDLIHFSCGPRGFNQFYLNLPQAGQIEIKIMDLAGRIVMQEQYNLSGGRHLRVPQGLNSGIYFINVDYNNDQINQHQCFKLQFIN